MHTVLTGNFRVALHLVGDGFQFKRLHDVHTGQRLDPRQDLRWRDLRIRAFAVFGRDEILPMGKDLFKDIPRRALAPIGGRSSQNVGCK
jgi:hypothetical protein